MVIADHIDGKNVGIDIKGRTYFQHVKDKRSPVVGQPAKSKATDNSMVAMAAPVPIPPRRKKVSRLGGGDHEDRRPGGQCSPTVGLHGLLFHSRQDQGEHSPSRQEDGAGF